MFVFFFFFKSWITRVCLPKKGFICKTFDLCDQIIGERNCEGEGGKAKIELKNICNKLSIQTIGIKKPILLFTF